MGRWIPAALTLLCAVLSGVGALDVNIPESEYEFARGDNITLPCIFKSNLPSPQLIIISWTALRTTSGNQEVLILTYYHPQKKLDIKTLYEGRVSLDVDVATGKANLNLQSITLADSRGFECRVQIPGDDEGKPADTTRLVVLVAPSKPICTIQGKAEYGQNINLTCHSEEGSPPPQYTWKNFDVRQQPRNQASISFKGPIQRLVNISKETSGFYVCTSENKIRSATCNITLAVMPPSMNIGSTAGIIAAVIGLLIALIVIIYCCCCRKKKENDKEYAMGVREDEYHDKEADVNGENRRPEKEENSELRSADDQRDQYEDRSERDYDRDYDDRSRDDRGRDYDDRSRDDRGRDYDNRSRDDRGRDYDDRSRDDRGYDDRRSDYGGRDYDERHSDYDRGRDYDRRSDYEDHASDYDNRRERYDDDRRYEDERRYNDRRDHDDRN